jgi:hypothetical protein
MNLKSLLFVSANLLIAGNLIAQEDIIVIDGGAGNGGLLEATINGDTTAAGDRVNPNRIYELKADEFYLQHGPILVDNPTGTITIRGQKGGGKPVILKQVVDEINIGQNEINSSLTFQNIQYENMETDNTVPWVAFAINGDNHRVLVEDCLIEFSQGIVFNAGNVTKGAKIILRNNYFRDMNDFSQWWGARAAECKYAIDSLVIENNTFSGGGLTFLSQESVTDVAIINHNTLINNHKYPFLNQYWRECYFTNNLFVNANMVGEDHENVATGGQDPDGLLEGIFGVDTIEATLNIQPKFLDGENLTADVATFDKYVIYAADNVVTYSPTLDTYYNGTVDGVFEDAAASYLTWGGGDPPPPYKVVNVPGIWQNERTDALVADWPNIKEENNSIYEMTLEDLGLGTDPLPQDAADVFVQWNRAQWGVPDAVAPTDFSVYYFGDHDPGTIPGVETETAPSGSGGITKISDMIEDFSYTADLTSQSDGLRIGALHWNDEEFDAAASLAAIKAKYAGEGPTVVKPVKENGMFVYPNPVRNVLNIKNAKNADITIMNLDGRVVKSAKNVTSVNVSDLADGMYTITIKEGNKVSKQKVLISKN